MLSKRGDLERHGVRSHLLALLAQIIQTNFDVLIVVVNLFFVEMRLVS